MTLALAVLLLACSEKEEEDTSHATDGGSEDGGAGDGGAECGTTQGFAYGVVTRVDSTEPATEARVKAWDRSSKEYVDGELGGDGSYELNLEGDREWVIWAYEGDCYSDNVELYVEACEEYELDLPLVDCDVADAPNLYLYPEVDTPVAVKLRLHPAQRVVASAPEYRGAWRGLAHPDGTFTTGGQRAPFLFYEASLLAGQADAMQRQAGWCLGPELDGIEAMAELLGEYGFDARERADFVEAWHGTMPESASGYAVYPQLRVDHLVGIELSPALPLHRLWLLVEDGAACIAEHEPLVQPFDRRGGHAVEWGVVLHDIVK